MCTNWHYFEKRESEQRIGGIIASKIVENQFS